LELLSPDRNLPHTLRGRRGLPTNYGVRVPPPFEDCSALQTMTGSAGRVASDTEWVTEALDVTIYKGLEIQVEGIQLATDYKF